MIVRYWLELLFIGAERNVYSKMTNSYARITTVFLKAIQQKRF